MRVGGLLVAARFDESLVLVDEWLKSRLQNLLRGPLLDPRFRGSWTLEGLGRGEVRLGRRVEADDVVVVSLPCAPPNFNIKSEDAEIGCGAR